MINYIFLIIYVFANNFLSGSDLYIILSFHLGVLAVQELARKRIVVTPLTVYYVGTILVNIANFSFISKVGHEQLKIYTYIIPRFIDQAAQIWCISSTMVVIGYELFKNKSLPSVFLEVRSQKMLKNIFYFLLLLNLAQIWGYGIGRSQVGKMLGLLNAIGILFYARLWASENNKGYRTYALTLYVLLTWFFLNNSYLRFELIMPTFYLFIGYFVGKGEMRYLLSYRIIPVVVIVSIYSSAFSELESNRSNFLATFTKKEERRSVVIAPSERESGGFLDRSSNVAQLTNCVSLVEKNGLYGGEASAPLITAFIPRFLWPNKPRIQLGAWFALKIGAGYLNEAGYINNSVNMTVAGELYLDFGWLGVAVGSLFFGAFIALLWNATHFYSSEYNLTGIIFGGYLIMLSIGSYADLQIVVTLISTYLIFLFVKLIAERL